MRESARACWARLPTRAGAPNEALAPLLRANAGRPAEAFFTAIHPGDTPETSQAAKFVEGWIVDWLDRMQAAFRYDCAQTVQPETKKR
jgi:hypothetical protein